MVALGDTSRNTCTNNFYCFDDVQMKAEKWKAIAIIFIILFAIENFIFILGIVSVIIEDNKTNYCYYDFCDDYEEADYIDDVCRCYEEGYSGEYVVVKEKYLK